ncbi:hypothetical protein Poli38472_000784 [Pythium oligandrum]|uniref:Molybdate-anion transporter n=1 Tax=Pythium oligandrum TaxID=41045 RepID=A0A8K1CCJ9_PYTOL|nr:hypothetical protein Poli38472_000784 [Pythium oligandrum]|eukprot:TMW60742.1 hypothetical protein Poli38472_000784 [Pythium oligandrum]
MEVGNDLLLWLWTEFQWPPWASASCIALSMCLAMLHVIDKLSSRVEKVETAAEMATSDAFKSFQRQYLVVYFLVMFADWLQGTHMYSLYESYDVNVSVLFLTGFLSSALFGNVVGPIVDRYGRRNACVVFCILEIIINVLENIPNMTVLLLGRVLGGVSTSLLFSAFESWLVTEHRAKGFHDDLLAKTFAIASEGNGLLAVLAGIVAQVAADHMGEIGPFRLAVLVTVLALVCVLSWSENYGDRQESDRKPSADDSMGYPMKWSFSVYALGLCYSLFEGAMYVFVFLWYPTLYVVVPDSNLPSGLVFSSFMLCISIGGKFYDMLSQRVKEEHLASALCAVSGLMFVVPTVSNRFEWVFASFLVFEFCVGAFSPCCATLRSRYFPNDRLSTILSTFRFPTNVLVVLGTGGVNYVSRELLFQFCSVIMIAATVCGYVLLRQQRPTGSKGKIE